MNKAKNVLIVEDDASLRDALLSQLKVKGYDVVLATNGAEGLAAVKVKKPDLILLDIIMPVMDGVTMLHELRANKDYELIPVIVLTNKADSESISEVVDSDVTDYMVKADWTLEDIVKKVEDRLK